MLRLLGKDKTPLGLLVNCKDIIIESDLKTGLKTLSFSYPITDDLANKIEGETYIQTEDYEFVVKEVNKSNNDWFSVSCKPNIETLIGKPHLKFESLEGTAANCIRLALSSDTGWIVEEVDKIDKRRTIRKETANTYEIIQEVAKVFMIDIEFDTKKRIIKIYEKRGKDKGVFFTNQLNLKSLQEQSNTYDFITRLVPIGKDGLKVNDVNGGKDYIDNFQHSNKVIAQYWIDKRYTVAQSLLDDAKAKLDELSKPKRSYSANVYTFGKDISLGDTITLIDNIKGIKEKQRVVKLKQYPLSPEKDIVEIANRTLSFTEQQKQLQDSAATLDDITMDNGAIDGSKIEGLPKVEVDMEIPDGSITGDKIAGNTITGDKIHGNTITGNHIIGGSITANQLEAGIIKANSILVEDAAITRAKIAEAAIGNAQIEDAAIDNAKIDKLAVGSAQIQDLAVGTAQIADAAITNAKIGKLAVDNANIKDATITNAKIKDLHADKITAGDIDADRIKTNVIEAINGSFGTINSDKITVGNLNAGNITTGNIDADRMTTNVIKAINADITSATIKEAKIGNLNADKITAGDISADRMTANAIKAINASIGTINSDKINVGNLDASKITTGTLAADRIKAGSIEADKLSTNAINAVSVKAEEVVAGKIKSGEIKVGNANIIDGTISSAKIDKIEIDTANIKKGTILDAYIKNLDASKITSGTLDAGRVSINGTGGKLNLQDNTITISDGKTTRVQVGKDKRGQYGILVMNSAGTPIFDSDKGVLSDAGLNNNVVSKDKIRDGAVGPKKLNVNEIFADEGFIGKLKAVEINADKITTGTISNDRLDLKGFISFEALDTNLNQIFDTTSGSNKTYINGNAIATGSISADKIDVNGLTVKNKKKEVSFAVSKDGDVQVNGLLQSGNFNNDKKTGYQINTDGTAILNQADIRGDVKLPNAGITNYGGTIGNPNLATGTSLGMKPYTADKWLAHVMKTTPFSKLGLKNGDTITYRVYIKPTKGGNSRARLSYYYGDGSKYKTVYGNIIKKGQEGYSVLTTTLQDIHEKGMYLALGNDALENPEVGTVGEYKEAKLEKGSDPTPWCPKEGEVSNPVRFWAGADFLGRNDAPFRVYQNGNIFAKDVELKGRMFGSLNNGGLDIENGSLTISNKMKTLDDDGTIYELQPRTLEEFVKLSSGQCTLNTNVVFGNNNVRYYKEDGSLTLSNGNFRVNTPMATLLVDKQYGELGGINILGPSGGQHILRGSNSSDKQGTLVFDSEGSQGALGDFSFCRKNYKEKCRVNIHGDLSVQEKIQSPVNKIEMKADANGWGYFAN